jgi:acyl-CoA thioester hydrolase
MYSYSEKIRVRYGETDQMGYLWHGNYALYYEQVRTGMLRQLGLPYAELEHQGIMLPIREMHITYYHPAHYDDLLTVTATVTQMPTVKMQIEYKIYNEAGLLLNEGSTMLVFVDAHSRRPVHPPQVFMEKVKALFLTNVVTKS